MLVKQPWVLQGWSGVKWWGQLSGWRKERTKLLLRCWVLKVIEDLIVKEAQIGLGSD